jgi:hypothetical protein
MNKTTLIVSHFTENTHAHTTHSLVPRMFPQHLGQHLEKRSELGKFQQQAHSSSLLIVGDGTTQVLIFLIALFLTFGTVYCFCLVYNTRKRPRIVAIDV